MGHKKIARRQGLAAAVMLVLSLVACSDRRELLGLVPPTPTLAQIRSSVVGNAAAHVDQNGQFQLDDPAPSGYPMLSAEEARALARVWVPQFAALHRTWLTKGRGAPIDFKLLTPCDRTMFASSPYEPMPTDVSAPVRRQFGPYWMVTLCAHGDPQVSLAVSAWATDLKIVNGKIVFPTVSGNEFVAIGIRPNHAGGFPHLSRSSCYSGGGVDVATRE